MRTSPRRTLTLALLGAGAAAGALGFLTTRSTPAMAAQDSASAAAAPSIVMPLPSRPPAGAVVLFGGKSEDLTANWYKRYSKDAPAWTVDKGVAVPKEKSDITTKQEFGDCYLHVEFRTPVYPASDPNPGHGNSGVGLQGRYEIQILSDAGKEPGKSGSASLYSQKASRVNVSKKPGEWQTYDIIFRAPRFDESGAVVEKPRATVFHNGVLVQNNEEFTGMTGIQYSEYKEMTKTGPIILQGDHDPVQFRNIWVVPM